MCEQARWVNERQLAEVLLSWGVAAHLCRKVALGQGRAVVLRHDAREVEAKVILCGRRRPGTGYG